MKPPRLSNEEITKDIVSILTDWGWHSETYTDAARQIVAYYEPLIEQAYSEGQNIINKEWQEKFNDEIRLVRTEVASEIFEEIEQLTHGDLGKLSIWGQDYRELKSKHGVKK